MSYSVSSTKSALSSLESTAQPLRSGFGERDDAIGGSYEEYARVVFHRTDELYSPLNSIDSVCAAMNHTDFKKARSDIRDTMEIAKHYPKV